MFKKRFRKRPIVETRPVQVMDEEVKTVNIEVDETTNKNKKEKKKDMINKEQISTIENMVDSMNGDVKLVKKDKGLIERTESSKIILTEDNRQVLND
jgi:tetrahydromethanopterin S-methyltransferase subunit F